jgi:predicted nucleotidyltransferase
MNNQSTVIAQQDPVLKMFLENIQAINGRIERVYLFGSRARKTFRPDSDYDLLIVVEDKSIKDKVYDITIDIFCKTNADISLKIIKKEDFEKLKILPTPFIENVITEGIRIA